MKRITTVLVIPIICGQHFDVFNNFLVRKEARMPMTSVVTPVIQ